MVLFRPGRNIFTAGSERLQSTSLSPVRVYRSDILSQHYCRNKTRSHSVDDALAYELATRRQVEP